MQVLSAQLREAARENDWSLSRGHLQISKWQCSYFTTYVVRLLHFPARTQAPRFIPALGAGETETSPCGGRLSPISFLQIYSSSFKAKTKFLRFFPQSFFFWHVLRYLCGFLPFPAFISIDSPLLPLDTTPSPHGIRIHPHPPHFLITSMILVSMFLYVCCMRVQMSRMSYLSLQFNWSDLACGLT